MSDQPTTLADTALAILNRLSGAVELNLAFDQMELQVPNQQNPAAPAATWKLNGSLRIRTKGEAVPAQAPPAVRVAPPAPSGYPQPTMDQTAAPRG